MTSQEELMTHRRDPRSRRVGRRRVIALVATMLLAFGGTLITGVQPAHAAPCNGLQGSWNDGTGWMKGAYLDPNCGISGGSRAEFYYVSPNINTFATYGTGIWLVGMGTYAIWVQYSPVGSNTGRFQSTFVDANGQVFDYDDSVLTHTSLN